jgi:hypothetical protein
MYVQSAGLSPTAQPPNPAEVYGRVITPYDADAFESALTKLNLLDRYPDLPYNIRNGFPIGDIPPLQKTYTPKNHKTARDRPDVILEYCMDEVKIGRMSGPYTKEEVHSILGGHFATSPLGLVEKAGEPGKFRIVRDFSFENEDGFAVNNFIDSDDFPTEWGTASQVAEIVSISFFAQGRLVLALGRTKPSHLVHSFARSAFLRT